MKINLNPKDYVGQINISVYGNKSTIRNHTNLDDMDLEIVERIKDRLKRNVSEFNITQFLNSTFEMSKRAPIKSLFKKALLDLELEVENNLK